MRVEVWGESKLQLRYFVLITARKFIFGHADSHNVYVVLAYHPFTIINHTFNYYAAFSLVALPDKPTNLTIINRTSRSVKISWQDPKNHGRHGLSHFCIKLVKDNSLILSITTGSQNQYEINNLTPYTEYGISVAAGNNVGYDDGAVVSFLTSEEGEV